MWLARGRAVVVADATGPPRPCGADPRPAVLPIRIESVLDGRANPGPTEVLVPARPRIDLGPTPAVVSLRDPGPGDGAGCARIPDLVLAGPRGLPPAPGAHVDAWRRYARALRSMSVLGAAGRARLVQLWVTALDAPDPVLSDHAARRLAEAARAGPLPTAARARLAAIAEDASAPAGARAAAVALAGQALSGAEVAGLATAKALPVAEAAVARLLEHPPDPAGAARARLRKAIAGPGPGPKAGSADRIRRAGIAAALAGLGDARGEATLDRDLGDPLFRVRDLAISGLAHLAVDGDARARAALIARRRAEADPRLEALLGRILAGLPAPAVHRRAAAGPGRVGLRMLLVLLGLLGLMGMALLPLAVRRRGEPAGGEKAPPPAR